MSDTSRYDKAKHDELMKATYREVEAAAVIPPAVSDLAFRRTRVLALEAEWRPLSNVAADCYLQGLLDAAQARRSQ